MTFRELLILPENLSYAWRKAKKLYRMYDGYVDHGEIAEFEINLAANLEHIRSSFESASYRTRKIQALPRPKKITDSGAVNRQYFHVSVFDQVAWIAIVNAIGPLIDKQMPPWSYGNRLYRKAWYPLEEGQKSKLEIGPYRHASGYLYKSFRHSWPLYRRHISLTANKMARAPSRIELDEADRLALLAGQESKLPYFDKSHWNNGDAQKELFFASIDLCQFFPKVKHEAIIHGLQAYLPELADDADLMSMISKMLSFGVERKSLSKELLENVEPKFPLRQSKGIVTGLFVGGFLANVAMLPIDKLVTEKLLLERRIAHFRFVDDHAVLAYSLDELCSWIDWYTDLLDTHQIGPKINSDKYDPPALHTWMGNRQKLPKSKQAIKKKNAIHKSAHSDCSVDGRKPTKLLTKTLALVSDIGATNFDTLDGAELSSLVANLEWLLLADLPDREIRSDTRAAFAAGQISRLARVLTEDDEALVEAWRRLARALQREQEYRAKKNPLRSEQTEKLELENLRSKIAIAREAFMSADKDYSKTQHNNRTHRFELLLDALSEHPGKSSLFSRAVEYCRITGHSGIDDIQSWIQTLRNAGRESWAHYYAGLLLQILGSSCIASAATLTNPHMLRSEESAARQHLKDFDTLNFDALFGESTSAAWFHEMAIQYFSAMVRISIDQIAPNIDLQSLSSALHDTLSRVEKLATKFNLSTSPTSKRYSEIVWLHHAEARLSYAGAPSAAWKAHSFDSKQADREMLSAWKRYPSALTNDVWNELIRTIDLKEWDSGWVRESIQNEKSRIDKAKEMSGFAFRRAVDNISLSEKGKVDLCEWVEFISANCDSFDPRKGEWTALEIVARIIERALSPETPSDILKRLHPRNVLIPRAWMDVPDHYEIPSWEEWRGTMSDSPEIIEGRSSLVDYRFRANDPVWNSGPNTEGKLHSLGRILLGLLRLDFSAPPIWNIKGNEFANSLPVHSLVERIAISSMTQEILESSLGLRASETRIMPLQYRLFGMSEGERPNDTAFDPKLITEQHDLLSAIRDAQKILLANQISVSQNQPRQLIPVEISYNPTNELFDEDDGDEQFNE